MEHFPKLAEAGAGELRLPIEQLSRGTPMPINKLLVRPLIMLTFLAVVFNFGSSCSSSKNALVEAPPAYQPSPVSAQVKMPNPIAPKLAEVQEAVHRVFKDSAVIDEEASPSFFTGDFNGDASQDLAVVLKPAPGKISEMNEEYPSWLLRDPFAAERTHLNVEEQEVLLAIIHGYGDNDWHDSQATQTYLLKNAVGSNMKVEAAQDFLNANSGRKLPRLQGDLIAENVRGNNGYLYFASSNYAWYDPKTFRSAKTVARMVHGGR